MAKQTMGEIISNLRKEKGMTQKDLAEQMGVTDKAVSKWERNLSCPDISSIPQLAEILGISVETLMSLQPREAAETNPVSEALEIALKGIPLAMGIAAAVLAMLGQLEATDGISMLAVGMVCLAIRAFRK